MSSEVHEKIEFDMVAQTTPEIDQDKPVVYLSGPIRKADDDGEEWRNGIIEEYEDEFFFNNPLDNYHPDTHDILSNPLHYDEESDKEQILPVEYVTEDKIDINQADYIFLGLPDVIARGSCMEVMYGSLIGKDVFVWKIDNQTESGWIYEHAESMNSNRETVIQDMINHE